MKVESPSGGLIRVPTVYSLHRSYTGRVASGSAGIEKEGVTKRKIQQFQNYPKKIRDVYVARPGYGLLGLDWAGIEWGIAMHFCAEFNQPPGFHEDLLQRFRVGAFDPHTHLASIAYGVSPEEVQPWQRTNAKPFTHGRTYLGAPTTLGRENHIPDDVSFLVCDAHEEAFRVRIWQEQLYGLVRQRHYVETPLGWRRYFWGFHPKQTEVLGSMIQATAADLLKWVLVNMAWPDVSWEMWTTTHDSMVLEVPEEDIGRARQWALGEMEQPIPWLGGRSWRADCKQGKTWKQVG